MGRYAVMEITKWFRSRKSIDPNIDIRESVVISMDEFTLFSLTVASTIKCEYLAYGGNKYKPTKDETIAADNTMEMTNLSFPEQPGVIAYRSLRKITNTPMYRILHAAKMAKDKYDVIPMFFVFLNTVTDTFEVAIPRQMFNKAKYGMVKASYIKKHVMSLANYDLVAEVHCDRKTPPKTLNDIPSRAIVLLDTTGDNIINSRVFLPLVGEVDASNFIDLSANYAVKEPTQHMIKVIDMLTLEPADVDNAFYSNSKLEREKEKLIGDNKDYFDFIHWQYKVVLEKIQKKELEMFLTKKDEPEMIMAYHSYLEEFSMALKRGVPPTHSCNHWDKPNNEYEEEPDQGCDITNLFDDGSDVIMLDRITAVRKDIKQGDIDDVLAPSFNSNYYKGGYRGKGIDYD